MAPEQRVLAMVQAGQITEEEAARLLAALRAHRRELPGWRVLITPMEFLSTRAAWTVAAIATVASVLVARLGVRFDGALDLHRVSGTPPWSIVLVDAVNGILLTAAVLWLASVAFARSVRLIDFVLAVALARVALVAGGIVAWMAIPRPDELQAAVVKALTHASQVDLRYVLPGMLVAPFFVWFVVLLYQGYRTASGLKGLRIGVSFVSGIIAAEILSKLALTVAATAMFSTVLYAQAPPAVAGTWSGRIEVPASPLAIVVRLQTAADGTWSGTIDIPQQGAKAIALVDVVVNPPAVSFRIPGAPGDPTIRLTMSEDGGRMAGTLSQGGAVLPVSLARGDAPAVAASAAAPRPQTPARPFPYAEEEVAYRNADLQLAGTLTLPRTQGRLPVVLLITGSGQQDRDETIFGHKPFLVIADHLTRLGIAVLRVDDRGVGGSGRGPETFTSNDLAGDVRAGIAYLKTRAEVDPSRIGLLGHSEGAMLAGMVAAESPDVAFVVMLAGTGVPGDQILYGQVAAIARAAGASDAAVAWDRSVRERVFRLIASETDGRPDAARRQRLLDELAAQTPLAPGAPDGAAARKLAATLLDAASGPWLRFFLTYDPRPALAKVRVPVLAIGGERDLQVPAAENLNEIERALRSGGNTAVTTALLPGLNHLLQTSTTGLPAEYATITETTAPAALKLIGDWIVARTKN